tara:strand:+ start:5089 stop:5607 length:519 start_codon:yes stop_codon:yes gene_type:complete
MIELAHPTFKINLTELHKPSVLLSKLKRLRLQHYCYAFWVKNNNIWILMNIGMSAGHKVGDRIYRKVGNLPGWDKYQLTGSYGSDMKMVVELVEEKFNKDLKIHKDNVCLYIWDTNDLISPNFNSPTVEAEKKLFRDCKEKFGCIPAGNIQDPNDRNKSKVDKQHFSMLFDE